MSFSLITVCIKCTLLIFTPGEHGFSSVHIDSVDGVLHNKIILIVVYIALWVKRSVRLKKYSIRFKMLKEFIICSLTVHSNLCWLDGICRGNLGMPPHQQHRQEFYPNCGRYLMSTARSLLRVLNQTIWEQPELALI